MSSYVAHVSDLLGHPGSRRSVSFDGPIDVELDLASVDGIHADMMLESASDEIVAKGTIEFDVTLRCNRCLTEWVETMKTSVLEVFGTDETPIGRDGSIDLEQTFRDEVALAVPMVPLCSPECRGLCPTCGTDLNTDPCSGHADVSTSPFGALRHLLEP
jgi:uncharacterized protein